MVVIAARDKFSKSRLGQEMEPNSLCYLCSNEAWRDEEEADDLSSWVVSNGNMGDSNYEDFLFYTVCAKMPIDNATVRVQISTVQTGVAVTSFKRSSGHCKLSQPNQLNPLSIQRVN